MADAPAGFMFFANRDTAPECLARSLFGLHLKDFASMQNIRGTTPIFLFNFSKRLVIGKFLPDGEAGMNKTN